MTSPRGSSAPLCSPGVAWTLRLGSSPDGVDVPAGLAGAAIPATTPGCVHTDLLAAGLIEDPYLGRNEAGVQWIGACDWVYGARVDLDAATLAHDRVELCFDGLDTVAEVRLNGEVIGASRNMHVAHRFDAKPHAVEGANALEVRFASPEAHALAVEAELGARPCIGAAAGARQLPHNMIRKMACNFSWDWGPQLVTSGVWRAARVEAWSAARLGSVRPVVTRADADAATLVAHADLRTAGSCDPATLRLRCTLAGPDGETVAQEEAAAAETGGRVELRVPRPALSFPRGHGGQPLYTLGVELLGPGGEPLDRWSHRVGLRTVELRRTPDAPGDAPPHPALPADAPRGESFTLVVNGKPVYCLGANWIPDDCFPHRVTPERYRERIDQAVGANMNMLRVWGGGIYEDHAFFEACDERGVMIWQDFLFACACYPEEQPLWGQVEAEARDNVTRLSRHPSLVLWNGCNENIWGAFDWKKTFGDPRAEGAPTWGLGYYLDLLPRVVGELAPATPYWPGSPYSGSMDRHPNANEYGNRHIWDVWNGHGDFRNYLGHTPRFASEFGFQGPPAWATLCEAIPPEERRWLSAACVAHNKQPGGQERALDRLADAFDVPEAFEGRWFLAAVNQARALTLGCEWFRALTPRCMGALYWQLNDCWPVTSWSAIDGRGRPKLLWHATRRFFRPRLVSLLPTGPVASGGRPAALAAWLHNDQDGPWRDELTVTVHDLRGVELHRHEAEIGLAPRAGGRVDLPAAWFPGCLEDPDRFLVARAASAPPEHRAWWFHPVDREIPYAAPGLTCAVDADAGGGGGGVTLRVRADAVTRELCLLADRLDPDATVDDQLHTLLPGEEAAFRVRSTRGGWTEAELRGALASVNNFAGAGNPQHPSG